MELESYAKKTFQVLSPEIFEAPESEKTESKSDGNEESHENTENSKFY